MRPEDAADIRDLLLFCDAQEETFAALMHAAFLQRFPPGVVLINERERADFLHVVVEGLVEMYASDGRQETTLGIVRPVGTFILAAVLNDQVYLQSARTLTRSRILMIPASSIRAAVSSDVAFARAVVADLARGYRNTIKEVKSQKLRTGAERLANWLLSESRRQGDEARVEIAFEKRLLASLLGMTPENLSRAFSNLRRYGVHTEGPVVDITDRPALIAFSRPDPLIDGPE